MEVEKFLVMFGATHVMKEYMSDSTIRSLSFKIGEIGYKLPVNFEGVQAHIYPNGEITKSRIEQAQRVAWRLIRDWIHAQLSIIVSGQAKPDEIMLPYMWNGKETIYEQYKSGVLQLENKENV